MYKVDGMIGKNTRFSKTQRSRPLRFKNPFRTTGTIQPAGYVTYRSPILSDGVTSLELRAKQIAQERWKQLQNAGMVGEDEMGPFDLTNFSQAIMMPDGVGSVEQRDKMTSAMRDAQRHNAGILSINEYKLRNLQKIMKQQQEKAAQEKLIEYLAAADEMDQIPEEFKEEVESWYRAGLDPAFVTDTGVLNEKKIREMTHNDGTYEKLYEARIHELLQKRQGVKRITDLRRKQRMDRERVKNEQLRTTQDILNKLNQDARRTQGLDRKSELIGNGWRAPRLFEMVRPHHIFSDDLKRSPEDIVNEQRENLENRQELYREQQEEQRGKKPPKEMVNRAMPNTAEPLFVPEEAPKPFTITPHPFLFRKKRFIFTPVGTYF